MRKAHKAALITGAATLLAGSATFLTARPAAAHGAMMAPGSRTYLCLKDGLTPQGNIVPKNPACAAAVAQSGTNSLYNWFAVLRSDGAGRTSGFIPDGRLCSGDAEVYDFSGFDLPRADWPVTHLTAGATVQMRYNKWAAHPGSFRSYVTKDGWDPEAPLKWSDLEPVPFDEVADPPSVGSPGNENSYYYWDAKLPAGKTGRHIVYSVWQRSDSAETFYNCSDVVFDGGDGEVTGVGDAGTLPPSPPATPSPGTPSPGTTPTPGTPLPGNGCTAEYRTVSSWPGGFQGEVSVTNRGTAATLSGWTTHLSVGQGLTVHSLWGGSHTLSGTSMTVRSADWNRTLPPGVTTAFGFAAAGSPAAVTGAHCTSP